MLPKEYPNDEKEKAVQELYEGVQAGSHQADEGIWQACQCEGREWGQVLPFAH